MSATETVDVHYGHLCTIRVTKFDIEDTYAGGQAAAIIFQVQANKTRAYKSFTIRVPYMSSQAPIQLVRTAWKSLTGQDITLDTTGQAVTQSSLSDGQKAIMAEIKEFVRSETEKLGVNLTLDVI